MALTGRDRRLDGEQLLSEITDGSAAVAIVDNLHAAGDHVLQWHFNVPLLSLTVMITELEYAIAVQVCLFRTLQSDNGYRSHDGERLQFDYLI